MASVLSLTACGGSSATDPRTVSEPFAALWGAVQPNTWRSHGDDVFAVYVCKVPAHTTVSLYGDLPARRSFTATDIVQAIGEGVTDYFSTISAGAYRPSFVVGGEIDLSTTDTPERCARAAIASAPATARAVLLVANAEHVATAAGGLGTGGTPCALDAATGCPVSQSQRWAYVGAADFSPERIAHPPLDLVEHEIGHTLGWVHSGTAAPNGEEGVYDSSLDVMSNSAAPRSVDQNRRDAPDTLSIDRIVSGWLPLDHIASVGGNEADVALAPSNAEGGDQSGRRSSAPNVLVLPVDRSDFLTVEVLDAAGYDAHLPASGVAIHAVTSKRGELYRVVPQFGTPPFDQLAQAGDRIVARGWTITVGQRSDGRFTVHVRRQQ